MRKSEDKIIDGFKYKCKMMGIRESHQTFLSLCSSIGEPAVKAIAAGSEDMDGDVIRLITMAITAAVQNLEGAVGDRLISSVFNGVDYVGDGGDDLGFSMVAWDKDFEKHFHGRLFSLYKVWAWSVEVNYRDFLDGVQALGEDGAKSLGKTVLNFLQTPSSESGA